MKSILEGLTFTFGMVLAFMSYSFVTKAAPLSQELLLTFGVFVVLFVSSVVGLTKVRA